MKVPCIIVGVARILTNSLSLDPPTPDDGWVEQSCDPPTLSPVITLISGHWPGMS